MILFSTGIAALSDPPFPKRKKFVPSLTADINVQHSCWNNRELKIAYNSAYIQTETWNFTFKLLLCISIFVPISNKPLCRMPNITVQAKKSIWLFTVWLYWWAINWPKLTCLSVNDNARTTCNPRYAKFPRRLHKVAQTATKRCAPGNTIIVAMTSHNVILLQDFF